MFSIKIAVFLLLTVSSQVYSSGVFAPHVAAPAVPVAPAVAVAPAPRYRLVAPQNIRPFAAQVSTFTKDLNVYAAPYAAGVLSGPAVVPRTVVSGIPPVPAVPITATRFAPAVAPAPVIPAPAFAPAHVLPAPAPVYPAPASVFPAPAPVYPAPVYQGYAPAPALPAAAAYPTYAAVPSHVLPAPPVAPVARPVAVPSSLLPGPFYSSAHAVSPHAAPVHTHHAHTALLR